MIADIVPNVGSHVAETKGSMSDFYADVAKANRPADVPIPIAKKGMDRAEIARVRESIRERVERQGQKGHDKVRDEVN